MLSPYDRREISDMIRQSLVSILVGETSATTTTTESFKNLYNGMPEIKARPIMQPFGLTSRAPVGTNAVIGKVGEHSSNRIILGHLDNSRKDVDLNSGEVVLYNEFGQQIRLESGKINLGKDADQPAVLGTELKQFLSDVLDILIAGTQCLTTTPGNPTAVNPTVLAQLNILKSQYITTAGTNILSQETFLERTAP